MNSLQIRKCGTYKLTGIRGNNKVKIKPMGLIELKPGEGVKDDIVKTFKIKDKVVGIIYSCNIVDSFLVSTKKLPMFYVSVIYDRPLQKIFLMKLYFYFTIESEVKTVKQLINSPLEGKFTVEVSVDGKNRELDNDITVFPGFKTVIKKMEAFVKDPGLEELIDGLLDIEDEKIKKYYKENYGDLKIPKPTINLKDYQCNYD